jgi:hypothetical protein
MGTLVGFCFGVGFGQRADTGKVPRMSLSLKKHETSSQPQGSVRNQRLVIIDTSR